MSSSNGEYLVSDPRLTAVDALGLGASRSRLCAHHAGGGPAAHLRGCDRTGGLLMGAVDLPRLRAICQRARWL